MTSLVSFPWPPVPHSGVVPYWNGHVFRIGDDEERILRYGDSTSNWTDDLTKMHDEHAGWDHPIDVLSRDLVARSIQKHCRETAPIVLEVGCSSGSLIEHLRRVCPSVSLVGSDFLIGSLEVAAQRLSTVPLVQFDLLHCPFPAGSVNVVVALNVLEHIDDDLLGMRQIARILQPGGLAHIEVPAGPRLFDFYDSFLLHHRRYTMKRLLALGKAAGLVSVETTHLGFFLYPAFWMVKMRNRLCHGRKKGGETDQVLRSIQTTRRSLAVHTLLRIEAGLGRWLRYPVGIRCVAVFKK